MYLILSGDYAHAENQIHLNFYSCAAVLWDHIFLLAERAGFCCADASWAVILSSFRPAGGCRAVTSDSAILPVCAGKAGTWSISTHPIILSVCPPHYHHFSGPLRAALSVRKSGDYTERCLIFQQDRFPFRCSVMDTRKQFCSVVQEPGILNSAFFLSHNNLFSVPFNTPYQTLQSLCSLWRKPHLVSSHQSQNTSASSHGHNVEVFSGLKLAANRSIPHWINPLTSLFASCWASGEEDEISVAEEDMMIATQTPALGC